MTPNVVTYNILVDHYAKAGFWERAFAAFERMGYAGIKADSQTYNHLLDGLGRSGQYARAESFFEKMTNEGLKPDTFTGMIMLDVYAKVRKGLAPGDDVCMCCLIPLTGAPFPSLPLRVQSGDINGFDNFVDLMQREKVEHVPVIVAALVRTYLQHKKPEKAMSLLEERRKDGLNVQRSWHRLIISHFFDEG